MSSALKAMGLMSGTSLDGVDVGLIETDGESVTAIGPGRTYAYSAEDRALFMAALEDAKGMSLRTDRPGVLARAEKVLTERHAQAISAFLDEFPEHGDVDAVGFHGQTVLHRPEIGLTVQIGDGPGLAESLWKRARKAVLVHDLRAADVAAGGQGAPLVPVYHRALAQGLPDNAPSLFLNLGGVANITYVEADRDPVACDTGPANALIDDFMLARTGSPLDRNGAVAATGEVNEAVVERLMEHPFFAKAPPKSLDRNEFRQWVAERAGLEAMSTADGAATLTALTARCVEAVLGDLPSRPRRLIVAGGGAHNLTLLRMLEARTGIEVTTADKLGWSGDALEAQAFAFLAVRSLNNMPLSFPTTTGVPAPQTGGMVLRPR